MTNNNNNNNNNNNIVLVTGGSGYVAIFCIIKLLREGYKVRTTVRSLSRKNDVLTSLRNAGLAVGDNDVEFYEANLLSDQGWSEAVKGVTYVMHVASPAVVGNVTDENELIVPALQGTLRVLKAAREDGNVRRVVLTSSFVAVGFGKNSQSVDRPFTEQDWTELDNDSIPYIKSKVLAEKAAWEYIEKENSNGSNLELAVINPVLVGGPILDSKNLSESIQMVRSIVQGVQFPFVMDFVDIRDVADLHFLAMIKKEAKNQRFLAVSGENFKLVPQVAKVIIDKYPQFSDKIAKPTEEELNPPKVQNASNQKAKTLLGWNPRTTDEIITTTINTLIDFKLI